MSMGNETFKLISSVQPYTETSIIIRRHALSELSKMPSRNQIVKNIKVYRKWIYENYIESIGLNPEAKYIYGMPLKPVVPLDAIQDSLFIIGAYPSARFFQIGTVKDVPVSDNLGPFEQERWFDGARVREQTSALELQEHFLTPMNVARERCWITDLVKVFLFKKGHRLKYEQLGSLPPEGYNRERFYELAERSMSILEREMVLAKPRLVITLGAEVAGAIRGVSSKKSQTKLLVPSVEELEVGSASWPVMHCAHPYLLKINSDWCEKHQTEFVPVLKEAWQHCTSLDDGSLK